MIWAWATWKEPRNEPVVERNRAAVQREPPDRRHHVAFHEGRMPEVCEKPPDSQRGRGVRAQLSHTLSMRPWAEIQPSPDPVVLARQASLHHRQSSWLLPGAAASTPRKQDRQSAPKYVTLLRKPQYSLSGKQTVSQKFFLRNGPCLSASPLYKLSTLLLSLA